jgi:hypothetical protein
VPANADYGAGLAVWSYETPDGLLWSWSCSCGDTTSGRRDGQTAIYALAAHLREQHPAWAFGIVGMPSPNDGSAGTT